MGGGLITAQLGHSVIPQLIKNMAGAAVEVTQLTYTGIIYAGGVCFGGGGSEQCGALSVTLLEGSNLGSGFFFL